MIVGRKEEIERLNRAYYNMKTKMSVLGRYMPARKFISPALITSNGVKRNIYSDEIYDKVTGDQLFQP